MLQELIKIEGINLKERKKGYMGRFEVGRENVHIFYS